MPELADHASSPRRTWRWGVATLGFLAAVTLGTLSIQAHARHTHEVESIGRAVFATDDTTIPDDTVLLQELE
ncbi:MAG: hypothetical protein E6J81_11480, partial [Deltaproteobacteria bacterium]